MKSGTPRRCVGRLVFGVASTCVLAIHAPAVAAQDTPVAAQHGSGEAAVDVAALLGALDLPVAAVRAREAGVAADDLRDALERMREAGVSGNDAADAVEAEAQRGPRGDSPGQGLGPFVRAQVEAGVRGPALAAAIREQRGSRPAAERPQDGSGPAAGRTDRPGRPDNAGDGSGGRPEHVGRPEQTIPGDGHGRPAVPGEAARRGEPASEGSGGRPEGRGTTPSGGRADDRRPDHSHEYGKSDRNAGHHGGH